MVGVYDSNGDKITLNSKFIDLDYLASGAAHEGSHRTIETQRAKYPQFINTLEQQVYDAFNVWKAGHPEKEKFSSGADVKDPFTGLAYFGPRETLVRVIAAKYSGSNSQEYRDKNGKIITLGVKDLNDFLNSEEGLFANDALERLEKLSLEELKQKLPGEGRLPLPRI